MTTDTNSRILKKLKELEKGEGSLPLLLEFYRELLQIQSRAQKRIGTPKPGLSSEAISNRIQKGLPLVGFAELSLDMSQPSFFNEHNAEEVVVAINTRGLSLCTQRFSLVVLSLHLAVLTSYRSHESACSVPVLLKVPG